MRNPPAQKGIHALFTPRKSRSRKKEAIGLLVAGTGAVTWAWALLAFAGLAQTIIVEDRTSFSIILLSIALPMIASGSTVFAYSRGSKHDEEEIDDTDSIAREVEALTKQGNDLPPDLKSSIEMRKGLSRLSTLALLEGAIIILLYIGLLREYDSSLYMRVWLQANLPVATLFLNDNVFFLMVGIIISAALFRLGARKRHP
jgi:hypothetical protein